MPQAHIPEIRAVTDVVEMTPGICFVPFDNAGVTHQKIDPAARDRLVKGIVEVNTVPISHEPRHHRANLSSDTKRTIQSVLRIPGGQFRRTLLNIILTVCQDMTLAKQSVDPRIVIPVGGDPAVYVLTVPAAEQRGHDQMVNEIRYTSGDLGIRVHKWPLGVRS